MLTPGKIDPHPMSSDVDYMPKLDKGIARCIDTQRCPMSNISIIISISLSIMIRLERQLGKEAKCDW